MRKEEIECNLVRNMTLLMLAWLIPTFVIWFVSVVKAL